MMTIFDVYRAFPLPFFIAHSVALIRAHDRGQLSSVSANNAISDLTVARINSRTSAVSNALLRRSKYVAGRWVWVCLLYTSDAADD